MRSQSLAILICTMNRPQELHRCLTSIAAGALPPAEVIVSDDSPDGTATAAVCRAFQGVRYVAGPRRGLSANRNAVVRIARTDFVSFLDDDALVSGDFVNVAQRLIETLPARTLVTGTVLESAGPLVPRNPSFLGYFAHPPGDRFKNINLNCNLVPRGAFADAEFDETIAYGYEDMDLCAQLLSRGYVIRHEPALVTTHVPPPRTAAMDKQRFLQAGQARFYTSVKRYMLYERDPARLLAYIVVAPLHRLLHAVKTGKWFDVPNAMTDIAFALRASLRERARQGRNGSTVASS